MTAAAPFAYEPPLACPDPKLCGGWRSDVASDLAPMVQYRHHRRTVHAEMAMHQPPPIPAGPQPVVDEEGLRSRRWRWKLRLAGILGLLAAAWAAVIWYGRLVTWMAHTMGLRGGWVVLAWFVFTILLCILARVTLVVATDRYWARKADRKADRKTTRRGGGGRG